MSKRITTRQVLIYPRPYATTWPQGSAKHSGEAHSYFGDGTALHESSTAKDTSCLNIPAWDKVKPVGRSNYKPRLGKLVRIYPEEGPPSKQQRVPFPEQQPTSNTSHRQYEKKRKLVLLLGITGIMGITLVLFALIFKPNKDPTASVSHVSIASVASNETKPTQQYFSATTANRSLPMILKIPKIKVDAKILYLGLNRTGSMAVPTDIMNTGWYKYGTIPGNTGSAVIVGHLDGLRGQPGVFSELNKLQPGDNVSVVDDKGQTTTFVVRLLHTYAQTDTPSNVFTSADGAHLNLITCTGAWDATQHRYLRRLVVFTDKV